MPGAPKPYETFWGSTTPPNTATSTVTLTNFGMVYTFSVAGRIFGMRYAREKRSSGFVLAQIFNGTTGIPERVALFPNKAAAGTGFDRWEHVYFQKAYHMAAGAGAQFAIWCQSFRMMQTNAGVNAAAVTHGHITAPKNNTAVGAPNGATILDACVPCSTAAAGNLYGIDVIFLPD